MEFKKINKETVTLTFYILYILFSYMMYNLFPGDKKTPNIGVLLFFCLIPISLFYAIAHVVKHFNTSENYFKCLVIHVAVWVSIIAYLNAFAK